NGRTARESTVYRREARILTLRCVVAVALVLSWALALATAVRPWRSLTLTWPACPALIRNAAWTALDLPAFSATVPAQAPPALLGHAMVSDTYAPVRVADRAIVSFGPLRCPCGCV